MLSRPLARVWSQLATALVLILPLAAARAASDAPAGSLRQTDRGIVSRLADGFLEVQFVTADIARITFSPAEKFSAHPSLAVVAASRSTVPWTLEQTPATATLKTSQLQVRLDRASGALTFLDASGRTILAEKKSGRTVAAVEVQGEKTFHVRQQWEPVPGESLYGLGQRQLGILDLKGYDLDLWQRNTHVVVPFLVSSAGYGILWDNNAFTRFGDLREFTPIPPECLRDATGQPGGLTSGTFVAPTPDTLQNSHVTADLTRTDRSRASTRWSGELTPATTGDYQLQSYSNGGIKVWLDGRLIIDHWRQNWLADYDQVKVRLEVGRRYAIKIESGGDQTTTMQLRWKPPVPETGTALWSEVGDGIDYYFVNGPSLDRVVAGYRELTGRASLMPRWAFGLWQSKQRYETAQQSLDVVKEYRQRGIPFDNIVQDWMYWPENSWGSHRFDPARFPSPDAWIKAIHDQHAHLMISVWGKFYSGDYPGNENFQAMQQAGYLFQPTLTEKIRDWVGRNGGYNYTFYDAFNPGARKLFWDQLNPALFQKGVDAWWMDATEPDVVQPSPPTLETMHHFIGQTALGTASRVMNAYPLVNSQGVYEGQRSAAPDQRVFILTRSGFAGIQRYATAVWSGDITSTWTALAKQIPAALGFSLSGVPYWTMDIGGYTMQSRFSAKTPTPEAAEEWRELNTRWFQFGTFTPLTRLHGEQQPREPWAFGGDQHPAYQAIVKFDRLRYRMMPYLYSLAGAVTHDGSTMMRPLVMDFPNDPRARDLADEYLFGPAFLVAPITAYQARSRPVYLPETPGGWYDFWTGGAVAGGQTVEAPAPYDAMPVHVRAGAIIPFGPEQQYVDEKPADPITLFIYTGADGSFSLYEDDGTSYAYERDEFARIPIRWDNGTRTLVLGHRIGSFPSMWIERTIEVVLMTPNRPVPFSFTPKVDRRVRYDGSPATLVFQ